MTLPLGGFVIRSRIRRPVVPDAALGDGSDHLLLQAAQRGLLPLSFQGALIRQVRVMVGDPLGEPLERALPAVATAEDRAPLAAAYRALFPEPGLWRVVRFGEFRPLLEHQLEHADRLRDEHRLPCYVQVYDVLAPTTVSAVANVLGAHGGSPSALRLVSDRDVAALGLPGLPRRGRARESGDPEHLTPNDLLLRLIVALDPTVDQVPMARAPDHERATAVLKEMAQRSEQRPSESAAPAVRGIPERYQHPWECRLSREEALCDMTANETLGTAGPAWLRLARLVTRRRALRQWRERLRGRALDEQLWATRPPAHAFEFPAVRNWARRTLALAGYDAATMLAEWEIFWRQRGV